MSWIIKYTGEEGINEDEVEKVKSAGAEKKKKNEEMKRIGLFLRTSTKASAFKMIQLNHYLALNHSCHTYIM